MKKNGNINKISICMKYKIWFCVDSAVLDLALPKFKDLKF